MSIIDIGLHFCGRSLFGLIQLLLVLIIVVIDITMVFGLKKAKLCQSLMNHEQAWLRAFCPCQNIRNDHCESERLQLKLSIFVEFLRSRSRYSGLFSIFASLFLESSAGNKYEAWGKIDDQADLEFCCLHHRQVIKEVTGGGYPKIRRETRHLTTQNIE